MELTGMMSAVLSVLLPGCQFPDYGFARGAGGDPDAAGMTSTPAGAPSDAGEGGAGGAVEPPTPCAQQDCVPRPPTGWLGPIAFWEGEARAADPLPDCPGGYVTPTDLHRDLDASAGKCSCTCAAQGQVCDENTTLHIFSDKNCATQCATVSPQTCTAVSGCVGSQGSVRAAIPTPSGGTCKAKLSGPVDPTWQTDARLCATNPAKTCEDSNQVCAPTPASPYASQLCIMQVLAVGHARPACPAEYPNDNQPLYETYSDKRVCGECGCSDVNDDGSCKGQLLMSGGDDCSAGFAYTLGSLCQEFDLGSGDIQPSHVGGQYTLTPGTCSVASEPPLSGEAVASGRMTVVCCQ
ncbi:MAG: hypothetical protein ABW061_18620 [Polyangiaceae bacterium]